MAYLLDTDWTIHALKGHAFAGRTLRQLRNTRVEVSVITVAELYEGAFRSANPQAHLVNIRHFLSAYHRRALDDRIAEVFAETRAMLRRTGQPISDLDLLIGASALAYDLTLLTFNARHFERIPDLKLYQVGE